MQIKKTVAVSTMAGAMLIANTPFVAAEEAASEDITANSFSEMFTKGTPSGQIRLGYIVMDPDAGGENTLDDFAAGGQLKFETAPLAGFSLGAAFYTSHSLFKPDDEDYNDEMAGPDQHYDLLAEAYFNYAIAGLNLRLGRQLFDTPFADSDDIRMTPHTFEAITGVYDFGEGIDLTAGWMTRWQGVDAGFPSDGDFGDMVEGSDGTFMIGSTYGSDILEASLWYYGVVDVTNVFYADVMVPIPIGDAVSMSVGAQIALQGDDTNAETYIEMGSEIGGELYGIMAEVEVIGITVGLAWDHASVDEGEALFGGWGGGPFFTNIDTLVANEFAAGQNADSYTLSVGYDFSDVGVEGLSIGYTFGNYQGGTDPMESSADADVNEHNFAVEYSFADNWSVDAIYVFSEDKENDMDTEWDYNRFQTRLNFTF